MSDEKPGPSGSRYPQEKRDQNNARAADRKSEQRSLEALTQHGMDVSELIDLRGRIAQARAIASRHGDHADILAALDGQPLPFRPDTTAQED
jgi:hypothetical protein